MFYFAESSLEGVPQYPLYNRLASALLRCMDSQAFSSTNCNLEMMNNKFENSSMQQKHNEWQDLIIEKGSEIVNVIVCVMWTASFVCSFWFLIRLVGSNVNIYNSFVSADFEECFLWTTCSRAFFYTTTRYYFCHPFVHLNTIKLDVITAKKHTFLYNWCYLVEFE